MDKGRRLEWSSDTGVAGSLDFSAQTVLVLTCHLEIGFLELVSALRMH